MEVQESGKPPLVSRSVLIIGILSGLSCVLLIVILGIVGSTHYRQSEGTQSVSSSSSSQLAELLLPLDVRFPGVFFTDEEIKGRIEHLSANIPVTHVINSSDTCSFNGDASSANFTEQTTAIPWYPLLPAIPINNGCCLSMTGYTSPNWLVDISGVNRTLATFQNKRQFFFYETCQQEANCRLCTCKLIPVLTTGVYVDRSGYGIATFDASSCCKCMNSAKTNLN